MGRNILIIGASGDIGAAIAKQLANDGYQLLLHYHKNKEMMGHIRAELSKECILAEIQADLRNELGIQKLLTQITFQVDSIVFTSGQSQHGLFQHTSEKIMDDMLTLHVKAPWMITKSLLPSMIQNQTGNIIFITSIWGDIGASHEVIYSSVKGAQNSFVKALAKEVAPCGISVNGVSPGFINTKMNNNLSRTETEMLIADIPMNRTGTPNDIAHTVGFLMDRKSSYIQGEIIHVTGGW